MYKYQADQFFFKTDTYNISEVIAPLHNQFSKPNSTLWYTDRLEMSSKSEQNTCY